MSTFTVLHVSDAHIGHPSYGLDISVVLDPLLDDVRDFRMNGLVPDLIIFSGDLVFGQVPSGPIQEQFNVAREFLAKLTSDFSVPLFLVPGNHDINRDRIETVPQEWLENSLGDDEKIEREARKNSSTWKQILERQMDWVAFVNSLSLNCEYNLDPVTLLSTGKLNTKFGVVNLLGLNTAWASTKEYEKGALRIGPHQLKQAKVARREMDGWVIGVAHHPPTWLHVKEASEVEKWLEQQTHAFLHGHEHDVWFRDQGTHLRIAAGACYQGSGQENVYQWIRMDSAAQKTELRLRTLNTRGGADGWMPLVLLRKTDDLGVARVRAPFDERSDARPLTGASQMPDTETVNQVGEVVVALPVSRSETSRAVSGNGFQSLDLVSFIRFLDEHLGFRWEPHTFNFEDGEVSVFWPVRLRQPTAIHAVQAFAAAGLARKGAKVCLSLDDFGNVQYSGDVFANRVRSWFRSVGADPGDLEVEYFQDVLSDERSKELWRNIQRLLGESSFDLQAVLRLAKYLPPRLDAEVSLKDFANMKPRRLLTPTLVWTALLRHWETRKDHRIITLGGGDEQILWKAWWDVVSPMQGGYLGHLYNPELVRLGDAGETPLHMGASSFEWQARADVLHWFEMDTQAGGDWRQPSRMVPWCLDGCVRLPAFIADTEQEWHLGPHAIHTHEDLAQISEPRDVIEPLATAVSQWFFGRP